MRQLAFNLDSGHKSRLNAKFRFYACHLKDKKKEIANDFFLLKDLLTWNAWLYWRILPRNCLLLWSSFEKRVRSSSGGAGIRGTSLTFPSLQQNPLDSSLKVMALQCLHMLSMAPMFQMLCS